MMNILTIIMLNILIGMFAGSTVMVGAISKMPAAPSILNEAQALMAFKAGINKDPFGRLQSWHVMPTNDSSPCKEGRLVVATWAGIVCDSQMQHVIAVNLRSFDLTGSVSPSLAFLTALSRLDLSHNLLYGKLPNTLFIPHSPLRYLNLSYNSLEGELPNSFTNLSALVVLDLSYNKFVGTILPASLGQLQNLEVLILERPGSLKGDIANEIWQLPVLRKLRIIADDALLPTVLPDNFGFCGTITQLHLEGLGAGGSAIPSSLGDCHKLEHLAFKYDEGLRGFIPQQIWQLPLLQTLIIEANSDVQGLLPDSFAFCHTIIHLELWGFNGKGSSIPSSLGICHHLEVLVFWDVVGLHGFIPPQIWQLPSLQKLEIFAEYDYEFFAYDNSDDVLQFRLHGTLPPYFSFCHSLTELVIGGVNLTGAIPSSLGQCTSLQILALSYDNLQGSIPTSLQNLTELQFLALSSNNLTGGIPPSMLSECSQLQYLFLGGNKYLGGSIPRQMGELTQLQDLDLGGTSLSGPMPEELCNCTQLTSLSVGAAPAVKLGGIAGNIPDCLGRLAQLRYLGWDYNTINGELPMTVLKNLTQLEELSMNHAQLRGSIPHEPAILLGNLSQQLSYLSLAGNELSGIIPQPFIRALPPELQSLDLSKNQLSGEIPNEIAALAFLTVLDLSQNNLLNGALPKSLENCSNLQILRLFQNNLTGQIERFDFSKLPRLQTFTVQQNNFTGGLPTSSFTKSPNLVLFDVQGNRLSGSFDSINVAMHQELMQIGGLSQLRVLVMSYNNLSGKIPSWLWKLPMLQVLDLSNNHFSGTMPSSVNNLTYFKRDQTQNKKQSTLYEEVPQTIKFAYQVLTYILNTRISFDVSMNHLEGEISESFGELLGLTTLNLSHNRIRGNIPASLGKLVSLDVLDLSHNRLTAGIPEELGRIGGLSTVDFSYNNLEGRIPTTGDFNTRFDDRSFAHNARLCGAPLATSTCSSHDSGRGRTTSTSSANLSLGSEGAQNYGRKVIKWFGGFTSPWGLLLGYTVGFLGVLYLRHRRQ